jgi:hypothetical protein
MPLEVELARTQLQERIQDWYRRNGQKGTHAQLQLPRRTTNQQQSSDSEPTIPTPRRTAHYIPGESSPIIIDSRTPTPTSPAYNRNSPTNDNPSAASTSKPSSLGGYSTTNYPPAEPPKPNGPSQPTLSSILRNLRTDAPPQSKPRNQAQDQHHRHFRPIAHTPLAPSPHNRPPHPRNVKGSS